MQTRRALTDRPVVPRTQPPIVLDESRPPTIAELRLLASAAWAAYQDDPPGVLPPRRPESDELYRAELALQCGSYEAADQLLAQLARRRAPWWRR